MSKDAIKNIINRRIQLEKDMLKLITDFTEETDIEVGDVYYRLETIGFDDGFGDGPKPYKKYNVKIKLEFPE